MRVDHIGYVVPSLQAAKQTFELLGFEIAYPPYADEHFDQEVLFMLAEDGQTTVELICPRSASATSAPLLQKRGPGAYHICFSTDDFDQDYIALRKQRFVPTGCPIVAETGPLNGMKLVFLMRPGFGIIELVEGEGSRPHIAAS